MNAQTTNPTCCLCGKTCECPYGNNPAPLQTEELVVEREITTGNKNWIFIKPKINENERCCNVCNAEKVIPARILQSCGAPSKQEFLKECKEITKEKICEVAREMSFEILGYADPYDLKRRVLTTPDPDPFSKHLKEVVVLGFKAIEKEIDDTLNLVMGYVQSRFERHLAIRVRTSPEDVCRTTTLLIRTLLNQEYPELLKCLKKFEGEFFTHAEKIRKVAEEQVSQVVLETEPQINKTELRRETEKERTKNANRKREQEKQQKKEQERQLAIANARRLQQQQQRAKEIAKKKKQATLNALQKIAV